MVRGDGEVVRENTTTSSEVNLQLVVDGIERDTQFSVQVVACSILTCRRSSPRELCESFHRERKVGEKERE